MIQAIFKDKRMVGYATVGYCSSDPEEVVVELEEDTIKGIVGTEQWDEIFDTIHLANDDAEIVSNLQDSPEASKILPTNVANPQFVLLESITAEELDHILSKYPSYEVDYAYEAGKKFVYRSKLYKVVQAHTSQESWQPDIVPALYTEVMPEGVIGPWRQPLGAHDAYRTGDRVTFNGQVYVCTLDYNVYAPDVTGWELYQETPEYPEWVQPTGAHYAYATGAIVSHNGQLWISTVDSNVWEPSVFGWNLY